MSLNSFSFSVVTANFGHECKTNHDNDTTKGLNCRFFFKIRKGTTIVYI